MVVFIAASIIGYWMYRLCLWYRAEPPFDLRITKTQAVVCASVLAAIVIAFGVWASVSTYGRFVAEKLGDTISSGTSARLLLGVLLGVVVAYATAHGVFSSNTTAPTSAPSPTNQEKKPTETADKALILSIVAAIALLALTAPYLDDWFARVAGFETSWIKVQLTTISASTQVVKPDLRAAFVDEKLLEFLQTYDEEIGRDISHMGLQLLDLEYRRQKLVRDITDGGTDKSSSELRSLDADEAQLKRQQRQLTDLYRLFHEVVSPVATCFQEAISNGLNVESVRRKLADVADMLTQLIIFEANEKKLQEDEEKQRGDEQKHAEIAKQRDVASQWLQDHRRDIWKTVKKALNEVSKFLNPTQRAKCDEINVEAATSIPYHREYEALPHLYVARAALLWFVKHDLLAIKVLEEAMQKQDAEPKPFKEFMAPRLLALLMYYQDDPAGKFAPMLEQIKTTARERQELIERVHDRCAPHCDELKDRARRAELYAMNTLAYAIAEDLAKELERAEPLRPIAEDYGQILTEAVEAEAAKERTKERKNKFIEGDRDYLLDTAAFVTIVTEAKRARSNSLDKEKVRKAIRVLEQVVSREEMRLDSPGNPRRKFQYDDLDTYRAHLNSARGLLK